MEHDRPLASSSGPLALKPGDVGAMESANASSSICFSITRARWLARRAAICASIFTRPSVPMG